MELTTGITSNGGSGGGEGEWLMDFGLDDALFPMAVVIPSTKAFCCQDLRTKVEVLVDFGVLVYRVFIPLLLSLKFILCYFLSFISY